MEPYMCPTEVHPCGAGVQVYSADWFALQTSKVDYIRGPGVGYYMCFVSETCHIDQALCYHHTVIDTLGRYVPTEI